MRTRHLLCQPLLAALLVVGTPVLAQQAQTPRQQAPQGPATPPHSGPQSGTEPGNQGSTGWTGGAGGSFTGTSPHAPTPGSTTQQPPTVQGLDPRPGDPPAPRRD